MVTDFQERLRRIREEKDQESKQQREANAVAELARVTRIEHRIDRREKVERIITEYIDKFTAELPVFRRNKSFFEGKYKIEVFNDDLVLGASSHVEKYFSRITFLIDPSPAPVSPDAVEDHDRIHVRCKKTVRNRDIDSAVVNLSGSDESFESLRQFLEEQFFEFAGAYFQSGRAVGAKS